MSLTPIEFHLPSVTSTNDYARELLATYPYVFVSATHQTAGRGRNGKVWHGDEGQNAYVSVGIRHQSAPSVGELASYMAQASLSVIQALRDYAPNISFRLKYPNDVQALKEGGWAKIAGALVEHQFHGERCVSSIMGMGVNLLQEHFPDTIDQPCTSLIQLGRPVDVSEFIQALKQKVSDIRTLPWTIVHQKWIDELDMIGKS